jgi:hypothetical protein
MWRLSCLLLSSGMCLDHKESIDEDDFSDCSRLITCLKIEIGRGA